MNAGSDLKFLRFVTGRHDLPFYYKEEVELQKSFLDAFLKGKDNAGWSRNEPPRVEVILRKGNVGFNNPESEKVFARRFEDNWPIPRTVYTKFYLASDQTLSQTQKILSQPTKVTYRAPGSLKEPQLVSFQTAPFDEENEFTGHVVAHLNLSATSLDELSSPPTELDVFLTVRHLDIHGKEIYYTGAAGDPVPVSKGWLRVSLRKTNEQSPRNTPWHPHREYLSQDVAPIVAGEIYAVDVEIWPTNVVMSPGDILIFEISSGDTQGAGIFEHNSPADRSPDKLQGLNHVHFGEGLENYLLMPVIPPKLD